MFINILFFRGMARALFIIAYMIIFFLFNFVSSVPYSKEKLYDNKDPLFILNSTTFYDKVLDKNHTWIIEFYNSWCGHCKRFAPLWVEFAQDIIHWRSVVEIGVLDCSESANTDICREYMVNAFPTIRMFWINQNKTDLGVEMDQAQDKAVLRHQFLKFFEQSLGKGHFPSTWPSIAAISQKDLRGCVSAVKSNEKVYVILERLNSYFGKEIIFDIISLPNQRVFRVLFDSGEVLDPRFFGNVVGSQVPSVYIVKEGHLDSFETDLRGNPERLRSALKKLIFGESDNSNNSKQVTSNEATPFLLTNDRPMILATMRVYMIDLENTLSYIFRTELGVHYIIKDDDLSALKLLLEILCKYFPGRREVKAMLAHLKQWADSQSSFDIKEMLQEIVDTTSAEAFLPPSREWVGCKGSIPGYRGYPCGVWQLFHTLTVEAYNKNLSKEDKGNPHRVLLAMREYIEHFFSCQECAKHFLLMSNNLAHDLQSPNDTVMWLWWAHNNVNQRLSGDFTEDPAFPKVQFPPAKMCYNCKADPQQDVQPIKWNLYEILPFLLKFYHKSRIDLRNLSPRKANALGLQYSSHIPPSAGYYTELSGFGYFNEFDLSLCLFLYVGSASILILLYFMFVVKKKRRKHMIKVAITA